jgi:transcription termination/antitermination protein NusA
MIIINDFKQVTAQIESERGVSQEQLIFAIEQALVSACKRKFPEEAVLVAEIDPETGEANIFQQKTAVRKVENDVLELTVAAAKKIDSEAKKDTVVNIDVTPSDFGRIAAQTAKQVIMQRIREAEKQVIFDEYQDKVGEIILGVVQRVENKNYLINLGRTEALLYHRDQIPSEQYSPKDKVRVFLVDIDRGSRGAQLYISRTHPAFLRKLFEIEIPEIPEGVIEVKSVAREPGYRSKVAVKSNNAAVGAVGTCVGHMGSRIQGIIRELKNEKIDVLEWDEDPRVFIANALKPAKISQVIIIDGDERNAVVVVQKDQLSLAIGKNGVNVRLAVKLTNWKLDILSEEEYVKRAPEITEKTHVSIIEKIKMEKEKERERAKNKKEEGKIDFSSFKLVRDEGDGASDMTLSTLSEMLDMDFAKLEKKVASLGLGIKNNDDVLTNDQVKIIKESLKK